VQGTTLGPLIKWLGVARPVASDGVPPVAVARAELERAALRLIEERGNDEIVGPIARDLIPEFRERAGQAARTHEAGGAARAEQTARLALRLDAIEVARERLVAMHRAGDIHDEVMLVLEQELDFDELRLRGQIAH
jgi:CPA1 family monovalent cation:H+ antiporter